MSGKPKKQVDQVSLPVSFVTPDELKSTYATNLVVQHTEHEFIISFYEARPPILLGAPADVRAKLQTVGEVKAVCVARVVVSPNRMADFIQVMQQNLATFKAGCSEEK